MYGCDREMSERRFLPLYAVGMMKDDSRRSTHHPCCALWFYFPPRAQRFEKESLCTLCAPWFYFPPRAQRAQRFEKESLCTCHAGRKPAHPGTVLTTLLPFPSVRDTTTMLKTLFQLRADPNSRLTVQRWQPMHDDILPTAGRSGYDIHNM